MPKFRITIEALDKDTPLHGPAIIDIEAANYNTGSFSEVLLGALSVIGATVTKVGGEPV